MNKKIIPYIGWYGVIAILGAYALISFGLITSKSPVYQLLNITGAASIAYEAASKKDTQPMILNIIWAAIATISIVNIFID